MVHGAHWNSGGSDPPSPPPQRSPSSDDAWGPSWPLKLPVASEGGQPRVHDHGLSWLPEYDWGDTNRGNVALKKPQKVVEDKPAEMGLLLDGYIPQLERHANDPDIVAELLEGFLYACLVASPEDLSPITEQFPRLFTALKPSIGALSMGQVGKIVPLLDLLAEKEPRFRSRLATALGLEFMHSLADRCAQPEVRSKMTASMGSQLLATYGNLGICPLGLVQAISDRFLHSRLIAQLQGKEVAQMARGLAKMHVLDAPLMNALAERTYKGGAGVSRPAITQFTSGDVVDMAWAVATLGVTDEGLMNSLSQRFLLESFAVRLHPRELTRLAWAYGQLGNRNGLLMRTIAEALQGNLLAAPAQDLAALAWSYAVLGIRLPSLMESIAKQFASRPELAAKLGAQGISSLAWSFATLKVSSPELLDTLGSQAAKEEVLAAFNPLAIVNIAWALAATGTRNERLMTGLAEKMVKDKILTTYSQQELVNLLWSFATLGVKHRRMMDGIGERVRSEGLVAAFTAQELADTAWAFGSLAIRDDALMAAIAKRLDDEHLIQSFGPRELSNLIWAFASLGVPVPETLLAGVARQTESEEFMDRFNARQLTKVAWALAVANSKNDASLSTLLFRILSRAVGTLNPEVCPLVVGEFDEHSLLGFLEVYQTTIHVQQYSAELSSSAKLLEKLGNFMTQCKAVFVAASQKATKQSHLHLEVSVSLLEMLVPFQEEAVLEDAAFYSVDIKLLDRPTVIEVEEPSQFVQTKSGYRPSGFTLLKHKQLEAFGYEVISVPFFEWNELKGPEEQRRYLSRRLAPLAPMPNL
uniref:RAP domain-containing protein n=1 Tax=Eutreptiella gymnastica TaxID=73025 RepID=A0A7S1IMK2_9EUGL